MGLEVGLGLGLWPMPLVLVGPAPTLAIRKEKIISRDALVQSAVGGAECGELWSCWDRVCERVSDRRRALKFDTAETAARRVCACA